MDQGEARELGEALGRTYDEQRRLEEHAPPADAGRVAWAAFLARRAGLGLERAILERLSAGARAEVPAGEVRGEGLFATPEETATPALCAALAQLSGLPSLPWRWGETRDGDVPRVQWLGSLSGPVLEAHGGATEGPKFAALSRLLGLAPAVLTELLGLRLALAVLRLASPETSGELAPYLAAARTAVQTWASFATQTGRTQLRASEARELCAGAKREQILWLSALGVLLSDETTSRAASLTRAEATR